MTRYIIRAQGAGTPLTFESTAEDPREVFSEALRRNELEAEHVYSFWKVGKAFRLDSQITPTQSVSMWDREPGEELIYQVRDLPEIGDDARVVLGSTFMMPGTIRVMHNQESRLTERARAAYDELIAVGLVREDEVDNGHPEARAYSLTEAGKTYPRALSFDFVRDKGNFRTVEKIPTPEDGLDAPGM